MQYTETYLKELDKKIRMILMYNDKMFKAVMIKNSDIFKRLKNEGIEQNKLDVVKSMLKKKITYEDISDITGKSIKEIKEIEKSMKD